MAFIRVFTGSDNETHFAEMELPFEGADDDWTASDDGHIHKLAGLFTPKAKGVIFGSQLKGNPHEIKPTGNRHYFVGISGVGELESGTGAIQRLGPTDVALMEDLTGRGHYAQVIEAPWIWVAVMLDE